MRYSYRNSAKFFAAVLSIIIPLSISADALANIGVGSTPTNRSTYCATASTYISLENPADFSGTIDTVQIYSGYAFSGIYVATFERLSSTSFKARDRQDVGSISTGLNTKTGLSIDVEPGDYIGFYNASGAKKLDWGWFGGAGIMLNDAGDQTAPGTTATYYLYTSGSYPNAQGSFSISLYGTGTGEEEEDTDLVGTPTVYNSSGSASAVVSKPTGVAEDDIMFAHILHYNATDRLSTIPDGWVEIGRHKNGSYNQALYYKVAGASEGASYTFGLSASSKLAVTISAYRGNFDPSDPIDDFSNTEYVTSNTTYRAASLTLTNPNSTVLMFPSIYSGTVYTFNNPITQDAGWVEDYDHGSTSPDFSRAGYRKKIRVSGATGVIDSIGQTGSTIKHAFAVALNIPDTNILPTITTVSDLPDPQEGGSSISFSSVSSDADATNTIDLFVCKDSSCVDCGTAITSNCWASSSSAVSENASASFECPSCNENTITFQNGWNLFSPSIVEGIDVSYMEAAGCSCSAIYYWDPVAKSYKMESDHLDAGTGYWVAEDAGGCSFSVSGSPWYFSSTAYNTGTSYLIGSAYRSYKVSDLLGDCPTATVQTQVYGGAYTEVDVLHPWNAYWLTVPSACNFGFDPSPSSYSPCVPYGDVDLDGDIDTDDSDLIMNYTVGGELTEEQKIRANANYDFLEDGSPRVNVIDAMYLMQYATGTRNSLPVCDFANTYNYWAKVCDNNDGCSATTSLQSFTFEKEDSCSCNRVNGASDECFGGYCCESLCSSVSCSTTTNWASGYGFRKAVTIEGRSGAGNNYQVDFSIGSSSGGDFNLGGNCTDFPNDIAFTDNDGITELDYWIEDTSADPIKVWVEVADDLGRDTDIYIYYGKAGDTDSSDGEATFLFFDDFNDGSLDTGKWTKDIENGTITESGGYMRIGGGTTTDPYGHNSLGSEVGFSSFRNNSLMFRARSSVDAIGEVAFRGDYGTNAGYKARFDQRTGEGNSLLEPPYSGWALINTQDASPPTADTWYNYEMKAYNKLFRFDRNGSQVSSTSTVDMNISGEIALQNHYGDHVDYDWVAVRKYQSSEPPFAFAREEESFPNEDPVITEVSDSPDPQEGGGLITFNSTSTDADPEDTIKLYLCKDALCANCGPATTSNCWASSSLGTATNPSASYECPSCATSTDSYWAKVCDSKGSCSATTTAQTFSVQKEDDCSCSGDGPSDECFGGYCCGGVCGSAGCFPSISTLAATSVGTSTAQINGELISLAGEDSAYVWFKWGETESYGNETASSTMSSIGTFNASLSGLEQGQTYHFIAMAGNDNGTSSSIDLYFTTIEGCASHNISGWAWSENIGWVSFSCENCDSDSNGYVDSGACGGDNSSTFSIDYGVDMDINSGVLSGYAWSENIGWVSFNYSETGAPPGSPDYSSSGYIARTSTSTFEASGWARALAASSTYSGGWKGWIKLRKEE